MILYSIGIIDDVSTNWQLGDLGAYPEICPWCARRFISIQCGSSRTDVRLSLSVVETTLVGSSRSWSGAIVTPPRARGVVYIPPSYKLTRFAAGSGCNLCSGGDPIPSVQTQAHFPSTWRRGKEGTRRRGKEPTPRVPREVDYRAGAFPHPFRGREESC
eukprot:scaffold19217_cov117-Isochrysis_galbana.AAC.1